MRARLLLLALALLAGCTRAHYRRAADRETYPIIAERIVDPAYDIGRVRLEPGPGSRLGDPNNPDRPPKPPDDPAAALFMARPGGMFGSPFWEKDGVTDRIEPPGWLEALGLDDQGVLRLDQDRAVEVALLNSREYQTALEAVYLQALALTLNRFEFDLQWFARNNTTYTHFGTGGFPTETNSLTSNSELGFTRNLAAGGQLLADFANSVVTEFTGKTSQVRSNILVNLVQPLLRGAGRKFRLEGLTQAERDVLYAVRDFARFRKQFWASVAVQDGGYLDLLLSLQTLRNNQANLKQQEETYRLYDELFKGGRASAVERDQFFQSFQTARQAVTDAQAALESALDTFKLRLGLPPRLPIVLDDSPLQQFVLVAPELEKYRDNIEEFQKARLRELGEPPSLASLRQQFATLKSLSGQAPALLRQASADLDRWGQQLQRPPRPGDDPEQRAQARATYEGLKKQIPEIAEDHRRLNLAIERHAAGLTEQNRKQSWESLTEDIKILLSLADSIISLQTQARIYLIELPVVEIQEEDALAFARANRLDLQNRLGIVTDAWRRVTVTANLLRAGVDVVANANLATDPDSKRPFDFSASASQYSVGVRVDGPLNRLAERNAYRASLITYQRAKRAYVLLSDQVEFQIRQDLRQLNRLRVGFEISRRQVLAAARQFENARVILLGPRDRRTQNDTTTLNLLQALSALLQAKNGLAGSFINFEQQRIQLLLDLELLQLDQRGFPTNAAPTPANPGDLGSPFAPRGFGTGEASRFRPVATLASPVFSPGVATGTVELGSPIPSPADRLGSAGGTGVEPVRLGSPCPAGAGGADGDGDPGRSDHHRH